MRRAQQKIPKGAEIDSIFGDDDEEEVTEATMVGVDVSASDDEVAVVVGELTASTHHFGSKCATPFTSFGSIWKYVRNEQIRRNPSHRTTPPSRKMLRGLQHVFVLLHRSTAVGLSLGRCAQILIHSHPVACFFVGHELREQSDPREHPKVLLGKPGPNG